jgi:hypothetical protein
VPKAAVPSVFPGRCPRLQGGKSQGVWGGYENSFGRWVPVFDGVIESNLFEFAVNGE